MGTNPSDCDDRLIATCLFRRIFHFCRAFLKTEYTRVRGTVIGTAVQLIATQYTRAYKMS